MFGDDSGSYGGGNFGLPPDPVDEYTRTHDPLYPFSADWHRDQQRLMAEDEFMRRTQRHTRPEPEPYDSSSPYPSDPDDSPDRDGLDYISPSDPYWEEMWANVRKREFEQSKEQPTEQGEPALAEQSAQALVAKLIDGPLLQSLEYLTSEPTREHTSPYAFTTESPKLLLRGLLKRDIRQDDEAWRVGPQSLRFTPDGHSLLCGYHDCEVRLWAVRNNPTINTIAQTHSLPAGEHGESLGMISVDVHTDGRTYASAYDRNVNSNRVLGGHIYVRRIDDGVVLADWMTAANLALMLYSYDGRALITWSDPMLSLKVSRLSVWDAGTGKLIRELPTYGKRVTALATCPYNNLVAAGIGGSPFKGYPFGDMPCDDSIVNLWDLNSGELLARFPGHTGPTRAIAFSPNRSLLATGGWDGFVRVWDVDGMRPIVSLLGDVGPVHQLLFSPDGKYLLSADSRSITYLKLWSVADWKMLLNLRLRGSTYDMVFSPDGRLLATADCTEGIRVWDVNFEAS